MIKLFISESASDKDLYDDLYSYADEYRMTSRWTKDNVEKYLKRQKNFRRMSDADFDKVVTKVNKDFKRKKKVKSDPYSETSYKTESAKRRFAKNESAQCRKKLHEDIDGIRYCVISILKGDKRYEFIEWCDSITEARKLAKEYADSDANHRIHDTEYWAFDTKKWKASLPMNFTKNDQKFNPDYPIYYDDNNGGREKLINYINRVVNSYKESYKKSRVTESRIYDLKEITGYDAEEIFRDDYYEDLEELWNNAEDIDDFIYDCSSEWLDEDFIYDFLANRVGINSKGLKDKIHKIYIYWRGDDVNESYKKLHEQDVEIEVKHEGILEVPEGKNVDDLPMSHFEKLAKKKGLGKITKALNNLQVWNKKKDPKLSKWAGNMIDKLNKKLKKDESWYERIPVGYKWRKIVIPSDDDFEAEIEEYIADLKLADDKIEWDTDYHDGVFGDDRVISLYSSGEDYTDVKYKVEELRDRYLYNNA